MYSRVYFMSMRDAESIVDTTNARHRICISLRSPDSTKDVCHTRPAQLTGPAWADILSLEFHDCDHDPMYPHLLPDQRVPFDAIMAARILAFLKKHQDSEVTEVVVHCQAGISRSAGVAKFVADAYCLEFNHDYPLHNRRVYSTLLKVWGQCLSGNGPLSQDAVPSYKGEANDATG